MATHTIPIRPLDVRVSQDSNASYPNNHGGVRRAFTKDQIAEMASWNACALIIEGGLGRKILVEKDDVYSITPAARLPAHIITHSGNYLLYHHKAGTTDGATANYKLSDEMYGYFTAVYDSARNRLRFKPNDDIEAFDMTTSGDDPKVACNAFVQGVAHESNSTPFVIGLRGEEGQVEHLEGPVRFLLDEEDCALRLISVLLLFSSTLPTSPIKQSGLAKLEALIKEKLPGWDPIDAQY